MSQQEFNGRDGNGYQPRQKPPTTEYLKDTDSAPDKITLRTLLWFGWCCFCLGLAIGAKALTA